MPNLLTDLVIDRVDLVDEGANSAAFIELYKRKENIDGMTVEEILAKMKPEHQSVIQAALDVKLQDSNITKSLEDMTTRATTAEADLAKTKDDLADALKQLKVANDTIEKSKKNTCECGGELGDDGVCKACGKKISKSNFDEAEVLKSMPEPMRVLYTQMKAQKDTAEAEVRKAKEAEDNAKALAKAKELKALPIEEAELVGILKGADAKLVDVLETVAGAIEGTVLTEVGKSATTDTTEAWNKIESKANELIAKSTGMSMQKAIAQVVKENPDLYKEYLNGGMK